jgi:chromate reductase, NAD(P)H dehydrogenase (quinone)
MQLEIYGGLALLPAYNPDLEESVLPQPVVALKELVTLSDGILIACPEYAHGIPGAFKNALDWLVGGTEFPGKSVALINCSPRAKDAQAALRNVISTMSGRIIEEACFDLPLLGSSFGVDQIVADPIMSTTIRTALDKLAAAV